MRDARPVLVVDDQTLLRAGVRTVLERTGDHRVLAEASSLGEAEVRLGTLPEAAGILITDIELRREWAFDLIRSARRREPPLDVIVITANLSGWNLRCALEAGARGFLPEDAEGSSLVEALRWVRAGGVYLHPRLASAAVDALRSHSSVDRLVSEERMLTLLAGGLSDRDMSRVTGRPRGAINREISLLRRRLGASSRAAAVTVALSRGMLA
ncbi:MAG TPA: response regulator transcription factor [Candidatus Dormibacteraeota bacterium]|jgi:DNA-binding NarL/FixJ family response regulator|nr:response regulator transcription factor [Candidatus Dormibacteraeota bacterium]